MMIALHMRHALAKHCLPQSCLRRILELVNGLIFAGPELLRTQLSNWIVVVVCKP